MSISFNEIPGVSRLFKDYLYSFDKVKKLYAYDYRSESGFEACIESKKSTYLKDVMFDRNELVEILKEQNLNFDVSNKTFANIDLLREENTFAVVTGQQVGLLTGNYYTILKALAAVKLAAELKSMLPSYNFVPVFWLEDEDHDFLEINNVNIFDKSNALKNIAYFEKGEPKERYTKPVSMIKFDEFIEEFISNLEADLIQTDFTAGILETLKEHYREGKFIKDSFAGYLDALLKDLGIIFCDPSDPVLKKLYAPVFRKEIESFPVSCEQVVRTSADIENIYELQVKPRPLNLFYIYNDQRYVVEPKEDELLGLRNTKHRFTKEELLGLVDSNPERFSANVILRPVIQDYILPTISYIGGPSEVSYFAQLKGVYGLYDITMPVIFPRTSVTLIESRVKNFFEKFSLSYSDMIQESTAIKKILSGIDDFDIETLFVKYRDEFRSLNFEFAGKLENIDKNLTQNFRNRAEKFDESFDQLKTKFIDSSMKQNESVSNKLKSVKDNLFPNGVLQERVLNIVYYINKYDTDIIKFIYDKLNIFDFNHQLIDLSLKNSQES